VLVFLAILGSETCHGSWDSEVLEERVGLVEKGGDFFGRDEGREDEIAISFELLKGVYRYGSANHLERGVEG